MSATPRRIGVFLDYWWIYSSARQVFPGPEEPPPAWFGNVSAAALARLLVKRPPAASRRSERALAELHIFIRHYDPDVHRGQHDRVLRWRASGATVDVGPPRGEGAGFWQNAVSVSLSCAVVEALERRRCDVALVFAGDAALQPLFSRVATEDASRIELATWVAPDGRVPTTLPAVEGVWCHRLGEATFQTVNDDRKLHKPGATPAARGRAGRDRPAGGAAPGSLHPPGTAMAAAFAAAGAGPTVAEAQMPPADGDLAAPASLDGELAQDGDGASSVRRLTHRLFGRQA